MDTFLAVSFNPIELFSCNFACVMIVEIFDSGHIFNHFFKSIFAL